MAQMTSDAATLHAPVSPSPLKSISPDDLPAQLRELIEAEGDADPSLEEIEQILKVIDLPADVKCYLCELAALAEQVRKWEKETEAFVQFLAATADSALTRKYLASILGESGAVQTLNGEALSAEDVSSTQ